MDFLRNFSTREKNLWSDLLANIVVGLYYFPKMLLMILAGQDALTGSAMAGLVTSTIVVAIVTGIVISLFLHDEESPEYVDERDNLFVARGSKLGYIVLVICIISLMVFIVTRELMPGIDKGWLIDLSSIAIAHLLLLSLVLSSTVKTVAQLFYYRRGY